ncbi:Nonsense-mediated mRNA decay protein 5 [Polyrhizophydium stewartii]|uniref:Nonsense-mediated mRNA decay protein 5 n=1 Tax=Polyrhizophydium stewartii TaxID=2732419 RepID=A0ABR4N4A9_9FUNG
MDPNALYQVLAATVQPDEATRKHAEATLKQPNFVTSLLQIVAVGESDPAVRQAGAIYFKNRVNRYWDSSSENTIPPQEKAWIKQHVIQAISGAPSRVRAQLLAALTALLTVDFRHGTWPELVPTIKNMLSSTERNVVHSGLLITLELVRIFQWVSVNERAPLHPVLAELLPILLSVAGGLKPHITTSIEATEMLKCIIKTYSCSIRLELSEFQQNLESLVPWGTLFIDVIEAQLPAGALGMPDDEEEREKHIWWNLKKWAYQCLNTLFGRFVCSRPEKRYQAFAKMFANNFAPKILETFLRQIELIVQGVWMSSRVKQHLATFLEHSIRKKSTWNMLKPHIPNIITHFIFPLMCFSTQDEELWHDNPVEYIHKKVDPPMDDYKSPVVAACQLLVAMNKDRFKDAFVPTITIVNQLLSSYDAAAPEARNPRHKYGILHIMSCLVEQALDDNSPIASNIEAFLITNVIPEIKSPAPFLRARALDTLLKFMAEMHIENTSFLGSAFSFVLEALNDAELPVRVTASLALSPFFRYPQVHEAVKPLAANIMQGLMELTNQIDMDTLTHVMEQLVFEFSSELLPFAVQLATQLRDTFMRIMGDTNFNAEDDFDIDEAEDKTMAAMGVLKTIASLILSVEGSTAILNEIETVVAPAVSFVLSNCVLDLYEEMFEIIETATFCSKRISPTMWGMFPLIYSAFKADAFDYFAEMSPSLHNYVIYGKDVLVQSKEYQGMLIDMSTSIINGGSGVSEGDRVRACQLLEIMMLHLRGNIDETIPKFLELAHAMLVARPAKSVGLRIHAIEIVVNALFYNAALALSLLEQAGWTSGFFELWFSNFDNLTRVHDKRLSILTLIAILELPQAQVPPTIQNTWTHLFDGILKIFETYSDAIENRKREQRIADGEEEEEEDEFVEDDGEGAGVDPDFSDDEDGATLETLARDAARAKGTADTADDNDGFEDEDDDDDDDEWSVNGMMEEDIYFTTYLDEVDAYVQFETLMGAFAQDGRTAVLDGKLSPEQRTRIGLLVKMAQENKAKAAAAAAAEAAQR